MSLIFPEDIPHVHSLDELSKSDLAIWPCIEPENFPRPNFLSLGLPTTTSIITDARYVKDTTYQGCGWALAHIKNAHIHKDLIRTPNGDALALVPWWRIWVMMNYPDFSNKAQINNNLEKLISEIPERSTVTIDEPCTLFHQGPHNHWLYEGFLPLGIWKKIGITPTLLHTHPMPEYRQGFLDMLDIPKEKRVFVDRNVNDIICKDLWVMFPWRNLPTHVAPLADGWTQDHKYCYDQHDAWWLGPSSATMEMTRNLGKQASSQLGRGEKIFVCREGTALHRICINEAEAAKIAEKHGFTCVTPSLLSGEEEAAVFHQARIICGNSGGGLSNVAFSKPGAHVICLGAEDDFVWPLHGICVANQTKLTVMRSTPFTSMDSVYKGTLSLYVLDLVAFDNFLTSLE